ncbi:hypothetical protein WR25_12435 [Diploscapter pachys]|uniref:Uncharacterized protein n=1 Tax=Diploscapter pachys TaxID=2018661 RepID=A0A2A2JKV8_9BILA|nr:hypothetical protein WR25_12435 [Diploscapter pachys]
MGHQDIGSIEQSSNSGNSKNDVDIPRTSSFGIEKAAADPLLNNPLIKPITSEPNENLNICDAVAIDIGTSKCKIAVCKEEYIQIVEHEANRSVPSYVALSEQGEWLVGRMAENYAVCLQNVIYVEDCARSTMNHIVSGMLFPTIKLIDEPIAVAAAYAPKLNIHPEGDVVLVFCMGAGYLQVAAYFIQQKTQEEKANWTDLTIAQISGIEPIVENFAGDDIDRLIFEEMMDKLAKQLQDLFKLQDQIKFQYQLQLQNQLQLQHQIQLQDQLQVQD